MKKRFICLVLGVLTILSLCLTGCSSEAETTEVKTSAMTLTMYVMQDNVTEEAAKQVNDAMNRITKAKFKTKVEIHFLSESEYYDVVEKSIKDNAAEKLLAEEAAKALKNAIRKAKKESRNTEEAISQFYAEHPEYIKYAVTDSEDETGVVEDETIINENGLKEIVYPEVLENQVDIIYIDSYEKYKQYVEDEWLSSLDEDLSGGSKKLKDYVSPSLLAGVKQDGSTYAIPNNVVVGQYTYMLIDKDLFDAFHGNINNVENILDLSTFFADISDPAKVEEKFGAGHTVVPIASDYDSCMKNFVWYWNIDFTQTPQVDDNGDPITDKESGNPLYDYTYTVNQNKPSIMGMVYGDSVISRGSVNLKFEALFQTSAYRELLQKMMSYKIHNYFGAESDGDMVGVKFVNGDYDTPSQYEDDYYVLVARYPEASESDLYGNLFAVSASCKDTSRAMEIITYLNTNEDYRNLLQYGIKGTNYTIDEDGVLHRLNNDYMMEINRTGNVFIAHPEEGKPADFWVSGMAQNNDSLINPLLGFDFNSLLEDGEHLDAGLLAAINKASAEAQEALDACTTEEELTALLDVFYKKYSVTAPSDANAEQKALANYIKKCANSAYDGSAVTPEDKNGASPYTVYKNWASANGYWYDPSATKK